MVCLKIFAHYARDNTFLKQGCLPFAMNTSPHLYPVDQGYCIAGDWHTLHLTTALQCVKEFQCQPITHIAINHLDANAARVLLKLIGQDPQQWPPGLTTEQQGLLTLLTQYTAQPVPAQAAPLNPLASLGLLSLKALRHGQELLSFVGQVFIMMVQWIRHPRHLKLNLLLDVVQRDGVHAVPIIALLAFLLGAVIAFQGGLQLATYGANIFVVELISLIMLREMAPLICAVIVAGRSGSAYTAQLATMQINQEIVALKSLGQDPFVWLVLPKLLGLMIVMPLLTILSMLAGIGGGMVVAAVQLELSALEFLQRFATEVAPAHFWAGLIKAPFFALIIVVVGCMQGFLAQGGAESVGHKTTRSVVQSIFMVIITNAIFSIVFAQLA